MSIFEFNCILVTRESFRMYIVLVCKVNQLTFEVVVASAFQTSGSFFNSLFFCVCVRNNFTEVIFSFFCAELRKSRSAKSFSVFESLFCDVVPFYEERFFVFDFFTVKVSVDNVGYLASICDCFNRDGNLIITAVTACEYARKACHECIRIVSDCVLSCLVTVEDGSIYCLTDSKNHGIDCKRFCLSFNRNRFSSAGSIRFAEFHNLKNNFLNMTVFVFYNFDRVR